MRTLSLFLVAIYAILACWTPTHAQDQKLRIGAGIDGITNFFEQSISGSPVGVGGRVRLSWAVSPEFSIAFGTGIARFSGEGSSGATLVHSPQFSMIFKLDDPNRNPYVILGAGGFGPFKDVFDYPGVHLGYGLVWPWRTHAWYAEIDPTLLLIDASTTLVIPVRFGLIF